MSNHLATNVVCADYPTLAGPGYYGGTHAKRKHRAERPVDAPSQASVVYAWLEGKYSADS